MEHYSLVQSYLFVIGYAWWQVVAQFTFLSWCLLRFFFYIFLLNSFARSSFQMQNIYMAEQNEAFTSYTTKYLVEKSQMFEITS